MPRLRELIATALANNRDLRVAVPTSSRRARSTTSATPTAIPTVGAAATPRAQPSTTGNRQTNLFRSAWPSAAGRSTSSAASPA
jgi:outer membrane protein TolC